MSFAVVAVWTRSMTYRADPGHNCAAKSSASRRPGDVFRLRQVEDERYARHSGRRRENIDPSAGRTTRPAGEGNEENSTIEPGPTSSIPPRRRLPFRLPNSPLPHGEQSLKEPRPAVMMLHSGRGYRSDL